MIRGGGEVQRIIFAGEQIRNATLGIDELNTEVS